MRPFLLVVMVLVSGCVRRMPGTADVPGAEKYVPVTGARSTSNELAGRVMATYPKMIHDPALDAAARVLAEDHGHTQSLPGPLYIQELLWRCGSTSGYLYVHAGSSSGGAGGVAHLDSLLAAVLETDKDLDGKAFGIHRTRIAYVMIVAEAPVVLEPLPRTVAPGETVTLAGKLRTPSALSLQLWGPGELEPRNVPVREDGTWEPQPLKAPAQPGRYMVELVADSNPATRVLLVPLTVAPAPVPDALDRPAPRTAEEVEAEARRIVVRWRELAQRPPIAVDPAADERARLSEPPAPANNAWHHEWSQSGRSPRSWEYALLELQAPSVGAQFSAEADVLAVGAAADGDARRLRVELLKPAR